MTAGKQTSIKSGAKVASSLATPAVGLVVISLVSNLLMLAGPLFMLQIYDRVLASRSMPTLIVLTIMITVLYGFYGLLEALRSRMSIRAANLIDTAYSAKLYAASVRLKLVPGALGNIDPVREGDVLRSFVSSSGPLTLLDLPWMPIYLAIVFLINPLLGWLAVGGSLLIVALVVVNEIVSRGPSLQTTNALGARQRHIDDTRSNAEAVVSMGMLAELERRRVILNRELLDVQSKASDWTTGFSAVIKALRFLLQSLVLAAGAYLVIQNQLTGGLMIAASIITSRALAPVDQIVGQWRGLIAARQAFERIKKILAVSVEGRRLTLLPAPNRTVSAKSLATGPRGARSPVVSGIEFDLQAGEALGILGNSGSGKSSLARALVGVWPALGGTLRVDGALLGHYDSSQLSSMIGYLPQRVELFDGTVAENICRFQENSHSDGIIAAAQAANVHAMINELPNGYDTPIGERGELLSAGQRQRIGIARAFFGWPFLIVLDEPNSNLDSEGDEAVSAAVLRAREAGCVIVIIAHRPSAIAAVDKLLVLAKGRQVAFGPKAQVLEEMKRPLAANVLAMRSQP